MAVFAHSAPQRVFDTDISASFFGRFFQRMMNARMARAQAEIKNHMDTLDDKTLAKYDLDRAVVGKNGVYAWPF